MATASPAPSPVHPIHNPVYRHLKGYAFDPNLGKNYGNVMEMDVPYETLTPGPVGEHLAVIDYDAVNKCYYEPVNLDDARILGNHGLDPSESDPRFHQQMVYAVASETFKRFRAALGHPIHWRSDHGLRSAPMHSKLLMLPHAIQEPNAYYDPELMAIVFGYFTASEKDPGQNIPGQTIFACLSHDIIAHETAHALLDGIRPYYMEPTNMDVAAFHEAFADIIALLQHFSAKDAVLQALRGTGGTLFRSKLKPGLKPARDGAHTQYELEQNNPLIGLAEQFGDALELHGPLRKMIGTKPNSHLLDTMTEPHDRGSILVAAVFDAFFTIFLKRTEDLWRIANVSRDAARDIDMRPDLLERLADEASTIASHFQTLCCRAIECCPVVDITFGDYLRALITADRDVVADDLFGYRSALIDAFRSRGIRPEGVHSYSEDSLVWSEPDTNAALPGLRMVYEGMTYKEKNEINDANGKLLRPFARSHADLFGFVDTEHLNVYSFHHVNRVGPDGNILFEMVAQILERGEVPAPTGHNGHGKAQPIEVLGGSTVVFEPDGKIRYVIHKSLKKGRAERQEQFRRELWERDAEGPYGTYRNSKINFRALHRGF